MNTGIIGFYIGRLRRIVAAKTDFRIRLMNEIVNVIILVKMFTWEAPFSQLVSVARK
jgi:ATP-binding cassette subfamily C (CFTR/MRP) protein 4